MPDRRREQLAGAVREFRRRRGRGARPHRPLSGCGRAPGNCITAPYGGAGSSASVPLPLGNASEWSFRKGRDLSVVSVVVLGPVRVARVRGACRRAGLGRYSGSRVGIILAIGDFRSRRVPLGAVEVVRIAALSVGHQCRGRVERNGDAPHSAGSGPNSASHVDAASADAVSMRAPTVRAAAAAATVSDS